MEIVTNYRAARSMRFHGRARRFAGRRGTRSPAGPPTSCGQAAQRPTQARRTQAVGESQLEGPCVAPSIPHTIVAGPNLPPNEPEDVNDDHASDSTTETGLSWGVPPAPADVFARRWAQWTRRRRWNSSRVRSGLWPIVVQPSVSWRESNARNQVWRPQRVRRAFLQGTCGGHSRRGRKPLP